MQSGKTIGRILPLGFSIPPLRRIRKLRRLDEISLPAIKRLGRRAGVKRMSKGVPEEIRCRLDLYLKAVLKDAIIFTEYRKQKTVNVQDIVRAVRRNGKTLYGFQKEPF